MFILIIITILVFMYLMLFGVLIYNTLHITKTYKKTFFKEYENDNS